MEGDAHLCNLVFIPSCAAIVNTVIVSQSHHVIYVSNWVLTKPHASKVLLGVAVAAVPAVSSFLGVCLEIVQNYY